MTKQKIVPHLWFDTKAAEAAAFYTFVFKDSEITQRSTIRDTPSGNPDIIRFTILGYSFVAISAGPHFQCNPSVSFMINFDPSQDKEARNHIDEVWEKFSVGGKILMPLDNYPFSERYGWIQDSYGISWQLIFTSPEGEPRPLVIPSLMIITESCDKAEEATDFYLSVFRNTKRGVMARYPTGMAPNKEGAVMFTDFTLEGQWFSAMDGSSEMHAFAFNEAVSFIINCKDQKEIDYYWKKLSAVPESEQCGWAKDRYGVSWQILPDNMSDLLSKNPEKTTAAMLTMKKISITDLEEAGEGE